jgi:hypothetical protein
MFDFTDRLNLDDIQYKSYRRFQILLYFCAFLSSLYFAYLILFPSAYFSFLFSNPNSLQNTIINPRFQNGQFPDHGNVEAGGKIIFDTALVGNYQKALMEITLDKKSPSPKNLKSEAQKSYQAYFYPKGKIMEYKNGTLLVMKDEYYIFANGKLRFFSGEESDVNFAEDIDENLDVGATLEKSSSDNPSEDLIKKFGYQKGAFINVTAEDIADIDEDDEITNTTSYPEYTLFKIDDSYFQLIGGKLKKFLSQSAFSSQYQENMAISKSSDFLKSYATDENMIGFSDGTLVSYGISAYIVSSGKLLPINNTITFSAMGYDWNDVKKASADEISFYEKDKLFTLSSPHPNGTVLISEDGLKRYLVENGVKRLFSNETVAKSWITSHPIKVSEKSLQTFEKCNFSKKTLSLRTYSCEIPLDNFQELIGKDFEYYLISDQNIKIEKINLIYEKEFSFENLRFTLKDLLNKILTNYGFNTTSQTQ